MLALRIIATVLLGISCVTGFCKNILSLREGDNYWTKAIILSSLWGWLWRAFIIVVVWLL